MSDKRDRVDRNAGMGVFGDWIAGALLAVDWSKAPLLTVLAMSLCFAHTAYGAWFRLASGEFGSWGRLITEFGDMYSGNFLLSAVVSWTIINLWEVKKMHDYVFGAFVYLLRLHKLREWVEKKDAERDEELRRSEEERLAEREAVAEARGYQRGFDDGADSALNQSVSGDD